MILEPIRPMVRGVRCDKCGAELSHIVNANPDLEKMSFDAERYEAEAHAKECGGTIIHFASSAP